MFPDDFNKQALELIQEKKHNEAAIMLREAVHAMPEGWMPLETSEAGAVVRSWSDDEFEAFRDWYLGCGGSGEVKWEWPSYSHAWYLLSAIYVDHERYDDALRLLSEGVQLERDHPDLLCEGGFILHRLGDLESAQKAYEAALAARPWVTARQKARSLRGLSSVLTDLDRLSEAEALLADALALEPDNEITARGLEHLRGRLAATVKPDQVD